jgi:hypothetical protein
MKLNVQERSLINPPNRIITNKLDVNGIITSNDVSLNSSKELKQNILNISVEEAQQLINKLEPVKFSFKNDPSKKETIGFIAEDVPDVVESNDHKQVHYIGIISAMTKIVQEQQRAIEELKVEINSLKINGIKK